MSSNKQSQDVDREGIIESLIFMTGNGRAFFEKMDDKRLEVEYDRHTRSN